MQSLGCCFLLLLFLNRMLPASIHVEAALHQREKKMSMLMPKGKCPSSREREREELTGAQEARAAQAYQGDYTTCSLPGTFPFTQFKCLRRLLRSDSQSLESRRNQCKWGKKSSQRKIFRKRAPKTHLSCWLVERMEIRSSFQSKL